MPKSPKFPVGQDNGRWYVNVSASVSLTGKRQKRFFPTQEEAIAESRILRTQLLNRGRGSAALTAMQRDDAQLALSMLPDGVTLSDLARSFLQREDAVGRSVTMAELVDRYLKHNPNLSDGYVQQFDLVKRRYAFGGRKVEEVTPEDVMRAVEGFTNTSTRNGELRLLNVLWRFAKTSRLCTHNPVKGVKRRRVEPPRRSVFSSAEAAKLMRAAASYQGGIMVGWFALCLFAGLRPTREASLTRWADIDLEECTLYVAPELAKGGRDRYVEISDNLAAWLGAAANGGETVCPFEYRSQDHRIRREGIRELAGVEWDDDIMRHTFCSHWIAMHKDSGKLCEMAGHSIDVSLKHYRRAVKESDAVKFWDIVP